MNIYISVVSHGHAEMIKQINCLPQLAKQFNVVLKCNKPQDAEALSDWCADNNIVIIKSDYGLGFGKNNNFVFDYCQQKLSMQGEDIFIVLNPDLYITAEQIAELVENMQRDRVAFAAINLFKNDEKTIYDNSIRKFPTLKDFFQSFIFGVNKCIIDKSKVFAPTPVDWTAGSFMALKASHYQQLSGFNEKYFMYCEDIDLCYRSQLLKVPVVYYPTIHALHFAKHANRSVFSRHFMWHLQSTFRFLIYKFTHRLS
ncbi:glycosyltransferase [Pantoea coffeiphila]|uniref:glycosyltransferase n=1 Tax=Pantoea coffeiphila TaxID=1465635 RepID=UPI00195FC78C|nr:glycosyltransferase family 2 protein [Pantoea coffeiphila]MBM7343768.1 GT2 family glycosyltransferase [Pantoea coffeiphila]